MMYLNLALGCLCAFTAGFSGSFPIGLAYFGFGVGYMGLALFYYGAS
jgi:hypothetical protein